MSFTVSEIDNTITLTRGDTFQTVIDIFYDVDGSEYTPAEGDTLRFALKRNRMTAGNGEFIDRAPLLTKLIPISSRLLQLDPQDTKSLSFGKYKYDIELIYSGTLVSTIIPNADFILTPEVD